MVEQTKRILLDKPGLSLVAVQSMQDKLTVENNHPEAEISFIFQLQGSTRVEVLNGAYTLEIPEKHFLFFINPNNIVPVKVTLEPYSEVVALKFTSEGLQRIFDNAIPMVCLYQGKNVKKMYSLQMFAPKMIWPLKEIFRQQEPNHFERLLILSKTLELLAYAFEAMHSGFDMQGKHQMRNVPEVYIKKLSLIRQEMIRNMNEPPTIEELADKFSISPSTLKKYFKKIYDETPHRFINKHRMELARQMILSGKFSVKEVAYDLGYSEPSHFIVAFKKYFGITPKKLMLKKKI